MGQSTNAPVWKFDLDYRECRVAPSADLDQTLNAD
jgi:hypothetical protein